jgi:DNA-binding beta-propeller fold protein YncE
MRVGECLSPRIASSLAACAVIAACAAPPARAASGFGEIQGAGGCLRGPESQNEANCAEAKGVFDPKAVAVSPDGTSVYVVGGNSGNNIASSFGTVAILARNPTTGELTPSGCLSSDGTDGHSLATGVCTPTPALLGADGVTVSADGRTVFVAAAASQSVVAFARNPATGSLTLLGCYKSTPRPGSPCTGANIFFGSDDLLASADDSALYVASPIEGVISAFRAPPAASAQATAQSGTTQSSTTTSTQSSPATATSQSTQEAGSSAGLASLFTPLAGPSVTNPCIAANGYDGSCSIGLAMDGAQALTLSPEGKQLYAVAKESKAIDVFTPLGQEPLAQTGCILAGEQSGMCSASALLQSPTQMTISPDGHDAYVADSGRTGGRIDELSRDPATGDLADVDCVENMPQPATAESNNEENEPDQEIDQEREAEEKKEKEEEAADTCVRAPGLETAKTLAVSGDGSAVYAFGADSAVSFARDPSTGKLTETACASSSDSSCSAISLLSEVEAAAVSPNGQNVYLVTKDGLVLAFGIGAAVTSADAAATHTGLAHVSVACPARLSRPCRGRLLLTRRVAARTRHGHQYRALRIAVGHSGVFAIAPGSRATVAVRLDDSARRLLAGRRRLRVTATVHASRYAGGSGFGHTLVLALAHR